MRIRMKKATRMCIAHVYNWQMCTLVAASPSLAFLSLAAFLLIPPGPAAPALGALEWGLLPEVALVSIHSCSLE